MFNQLIYTKTDYIIALQRIIVGIVFFAHGAQKLLGWFGGYGYTGTMGYFTETLGIPAFLAFIAIITEFFGSLAILTGFFTRIAAAGISIIMLVAIFTVHIYNGFFMNWGGNLKGEGYEYHLLALALLIGLFVKGAGSLSIDNLMVKKNRAQ